MTFTELLRERRRLLGLLDTELSEEGKVLVRDLMSICEEIGEHE